MGKNRTAPVIATSAQLERVFHHVRLWMSAAGDALDRNNSNNGNGATSGKAKEERHSSPPQPLPAQDDL